jgi:hypothetical protein
MRRRPWLLLVLPALLVGLLLAGRLEGSTSAASGPGPATGLIRHCGDADLAYRLTTNSPVYLRGQQVRVTLTVRNLTSHWCSVVGQCSEVGHLSVFNSQGLVWAHHPCFNDEWFSQPISVPPARTLTYRGTWTAKGASLGWYEARAAFLKTSFLIV